MKRSEMLKPTLEALAYLHGRGFVHGHLKPANILVAGEQVKLASDGICRVGEPDGAETGTYGAPDLPGTAASPAGISGRSGVTLVQVLTQLLPVRNGRAAGVTLPETLPPQFADLARNCLEPDPQRRCTLAEIAERLHYKLPARTIGPPSLPSRQSRVQQTAPPRHCARGQEESLRHACRRDHLRAGGGDCGLESFPSRIVAAEFRRRRGRADGSAADICDACCHTARSTAARERFTESCKRRR